MLRSKKATPQATSVFVPPSLVAGSLMLAKGAVPVQVAYNAATLALDTERVCMILSTHGGKVHYLAGAAADFASQLPGVATMMAVALPGGAVYRGEGVYFAALADSGRTACLIASEEGLKCFVGNNADAERFPDAEQKSALPVYRLDEELDVPAATPRWRGYTEYDRAGGRERLMRVLMGGVAWTVAMGLIWVGASIYANRLSHAGQDVVGQARSAIMDAATAITQERQNQNPAWQEFQNIARFVLERHGRLISFKLSEGQVSWSLEVPAFTTSDELTTGLGTAIVTEKLGEVARVSKKLPEVIKPGVPGK